LENSLFCTFGVPETILTDNGSQFVSNYFKAFTTRFGVKHTRTAIYSPQANASERLNRSLLAAIRAYIKEDHTTWDVKLPEIKIKSSVHQSTGYSPYLLAFGQNMLLNGKDYEILRRLQLLSGDTKIGYPDALQTMRIAARQNISKAHDRNAARYNSRSRNISFKEGDKVLA